MSTNFTVVSTAPATNGQTKKRTIRKKTDVTPQATQPALVVSSADQVRVSISTTSSQPSPPVIASTPAPSPVEPKKKRQQTKKAEVAPIDTAPVQPIPEQTNGVKPEKKKRSPKTATQDATSVSSTSTTSTSSSIDSTKAPVTKQDDNSKAEAAEDEKRYFRRIDPTTGVESGRYSKLPHLAALKAFTRINRDKAKTSDPIPENVSYQIFMKESTRGSTKQFYGYEIKLNKLTKSTVRKFKSKDKETGEEVIREHEYTHKNNYKIIDVPASVVELNKAYKEQKKAEGNINKKTKAEVLAASKAEVTEDSSSNIESD